MVLLEELLESLDDRLLLPHCRLELLGVLHPLLRTVCSLVTQELAYFKFSYR